MKSALLVLGLLGSLAWALEEEEHSVEQELKVVDSIRQFVDEDKFYSYVHHLGTPAMHTSIEDGKFEGRSRWNTLGGCSFLCAANLKSRLAISIDTMPFLVF